MGCFGGGGDVAVPQASPQQVELQNLQLQQARTAAAQNTALQPMELQALGLTEVPLSADAQAQRDALLQQHRDITAQWNAAPPAQKQALAQQAVDIETKLNSLASSGGYRKMTEEEMLANMTPAEQLQYQNTMLQQERVNKALKGELPVDPALEKNIADEQAAIQEQLSRDLGPSWANSTAGIQRMGEFNKRAELLRESARRGEINTGTGLALSQLGYLNNKAAQQAAGYGGIPGQTMGYAQSLNSVLSPYIAQQQMGYAANAANAGLAQQAVGSEWSALGSILGGPKAIAEKWALSKAGT